MWLLTVPSGSPVRAQISAWERPDEERQLDDLAARLLEALEEVGHDEGVGDRLGDPRVVVVEVVDHDALVQAVVAGPGRHPVGDEVSGDPGQPRGQRSLLGAVAATARARR